MINKQMAKKHLNVDHDLDDDLIEFYILASYERVGLHLDRRIIADEGERTADGDLLVTSLVDASALKLVAHFYANREIAANDKVLAEFYEMLQPYRKMGI